MNEQNPENTAPIQSAPPPNDNKRRLRELLSVPERDRTDEQWDEIIELVIQLAPGNRVSAAEQGGNQGGGMGHNKPSGQPKKHRPRSNNNRRSRPNKPSGNPV